MFVQVQQLPSLQQWLTSHLSRLQAGIALLQLTAHPSRLQAGTPLLQLTAALRTKLQMRPPSGCLWKALRW